MSRPPLFATLVTLSISAASGFAGIRLVSNLSFLVRPSVRRLGASGCSSEDRTLSAISKCPLIPAAGRPMASFPAMRGGGGLGRGRPGLLGGGGVRGMSGGCGDADVIDLLDQEVPVEKASKKRKSEAVSVGAKKAKTSKKAAGGGEVADETTVEEDGEYAMAPLSSAAAKQAMPRLVKLLQAELKVQAWMVEKAAMLFRDGATLPFIARYRKDETGGLDEEQLRSLQATMEKFDKLEVRKITVSQSLEKTGNMTPEIKSRLEAAQTLAEVEDIYLPFKPKRKTRASEARAKGLQPLADALMGRASPPFTRQDLETIGPVEAAKKCAAACPEVSSAQDALAGARDIIAEETMENVEVRKEARSRLTSGLQLTCKEKKSGADEQQKYTNYHDFSKAWLALRPHEVLAISRGAKAKILNNKLKVSDNAKTTFFAWLVRFVIKHIQQRQHNGAWTKEVELALHDGLDRLLIPALEREWWKHSLEVAQESALKTFADNLRHKLLQPPVKGCCVAAIDPGYRSGCKVALVSKTGKVLATDVLHLQSESAQKSGSKQLTSLLKKFNCNGQASRETEEFLRKHVLEAAKTVKYTIVDEAGASVYSASVLATQELSDLDVSLRGAVSLARRVQDPLAELVKVDPKSIGVGLFQHDVDQKSLAHRLGGVVEIAVNTVGVDVNTASPSLLRYISGLSEKIAQSIVKHREDSGSFKSRKDILKVAGLGKKTFEQAAGFMRVYEGNPLDATNIHPESYTAAKALLAKFGGKLSGITDSEKKELCKSLVVGAETLNDMIEALSGPASDPREGMLGIPPPVFTDSNGMDSGAGEEDNKGRKVINASAEGLKVDQLQTGMWLRGVVRNVVDFGCFVDIGVQDSGLLHRSEMAPGKGQLEVGRVLQVRLKALDLKHPSGKAKISLSTKD